MRRSVTMGRVGMCIVICYSHIVRSTVDIWSRKRRYETCGVEVWKKPKDLSASEREERGHGKGVSTEDVRESALCT